MYVKTFVSETLDGAFKDIKKELGPEAIILKTVTNKGVKGLYKKNKYEITAAITEKGYIKKAKVDQVLNPEQKEKFYKGSSRAIGQMIDNFDQNSPKTPGPKEKSYGKLGLNRPVQQNKETSLDDFLKTEERGEREVRDVRNVGEEREEQEEMKPRAPRVARTSAPPPTQQEEPSSSLQNFPMWEDLMAKMEKVDHLEKTLMDIRDQLEMSGKNEEESLNRLRRHLGGLGLDPSFVAKLIKKLIFQFPENELSQFDLLFDAALRQVGQNIQVSLPLFSSTETHGRPVVTVLMGGPASGQSSTLLKLATMKKNSILLLNGDEDLLGKMKGTAKFLDLEIGLYKTLPELVSHCRKAIELKKHVFVDFRLSDRDREEAKVFTEGLRKSFEFVEVLLCLSAIHSEDNNRKILANLGKLADGTVFTFLDFCLNFSSIFNLHVHSGLPMKFFSTGSSVPGDIEAASVERIMSKVFSL